MWLLVLLSVFLGAVAQTVNQAGDKCSRHYVCPPQFLRLSQNCYYFSKNRTTWQDAFFACQDLHGKFAIVRNAHQDKMLRNFLNKISLVSEERWIGGLYDWEQMIWKWGASGREIKYKGFTRPDPDDKEQLKWHCVILDPNLQYKWNSRSCLEEKYYICQTRLRKVSNKERKKLQRQYQVDKYNKLNEIPVPDVADYQRNATNLKDHKPNVAKYQDSNDVDGNNAFAIRNDTIIEKKRGRKRNKKDRKNRRKLCDTRVVRNGTEVNLPQLKYGKRRRRNKSKESKEDKDASIENIQTKIYYSGVPDSPLHPRVITEELSFR